MTREEKNGAPPKPLLAARFHKEAAFGGVFKPPATGRLLSAPQQHKSGAVSITYSVFYTAEGRSNPRPPARFSCKPFSLVKPPSSASRLFDEPGANFPQKLCRGEASGERTGRLDRHIPIKKKHGIIEKNNFRQEKREK
ncbi:hypothetical protein [Murdochiella massiliensis]|uniref:hypothetical protein n=1 Tax=Murdochiella massiliensis TaxID=1673723 RepID=UPI0008324327|nr:hypothetical protein [Murdochiella massiliensis]